MFHPCSSRNEIVRASDELARSFATIGLLRHVKGATPVDMVCTYITRTNQSWGLRSKVRDINDDHLTCAKQMTILGSHHADKLKPLPAGIVKMAKDYLIREFWKHIDHLRSRTCMQVNRYYNSSFGESECGEKLRVFPKTVLKTLRSIQINQSSRIWDARNAIGALHSVCTPTMLDKPDWMVSERYGGRIDESQCDVIRYPEERSLTALVSVLDNYCWMTDNRTCIPNEAEKNLLLDLIESLIVMFGPCSFMDNFIYRQVYECSRLRDTFAIGKQSNRFGRYMTDRFDDRVMGSGCGNWCDGLNSIIERLRHLSPEAACCTGYIGNRDFWESVLVNHPEVLKAQTPQPYREVAIYLKTELVVQRSKKSYASRVLEKIRKGEFKPDEMDYCSVGCYGDEKCCDPCECPANEGSLGNG